MRLGKPLLLALIAGTLALAAAAFWWFYGRTPPVPPHPLSLVTPDSVVAISNGTDSLSRTSAAFRDTAALPSRLATIAPVDGGPINWATARPIRLSTSTGLLVWLQRVEQTGATWIRVTADPLPGAGADAQRQARAIRELRLNAYRVATALDSSRPQPMGDHGTTRDVLRH